MRIVRYALEGFKPQYQDYHLKDVDYYLNRFNLEDFPPHLHHAMKEIQRQRISFYQTHQENLQYGVWAFIDGYKSNQSLNHLKRKVPCWKADISDETLVYGVNWDEQLIITDEKCKLFGFFIPESQLHTLRLLSTTHD